jgi:hypothetical protein
MRLFRSSSLLRLALVCIFRGVPSGVADECDESDDECDEYNNKWGSTVIEVQASPKSKSEL